jgi:hypothetical protein
VDERQEMFEYLIGPVGVSPEEAEPILDDDDLFLTNPGTRYGYEPRDAIRVWAEAQVKLNHLSEAASNGDVSATRAFRCSCGTQLRGPRSCAVGLGSGPRLRQSRRRYHRARIF